MLCSAKQVRLCAVFLHRLLSVLLLSGACLGASCVAKQHHLCAIFPRGTLRYTSFPVRPRRRESPLCSRDHFVCGLTDTSHHCGMQQHDGIPQVAHFPFGDLAQDHGFGWIRKSGIDSKCFLFSVATGRSASNAVAAMNRSGSVTCLRCRFNSAWIVAARRTSLDPSGNTSMCSSTRLQYASWPVWHQRTLHIP